MIVILSNSLDVTSDYICSRLKQNRINYIRLNTDELIEQSELLYKNNEIILKICNQYLTPNSIKSIYYRRPKPLKLINYKNNDEGEKSHTCNEWSAAIEGFLAHIPEQLWINHPKNNTFAGSKLEQLSRARRLGLKIPKTLITQSWKEVIYFWRECQEKIIVKPISHGYIERENSQDDTLIFTNRLSIEKLEKNKDILALCPTLFQEEVEKQCDVRVNIIDKEVIAVAIYSSKKESLQKIDIRRDNMQGVKYQLIELPNLVKTNLLALCYSYRLRFAAIDLAISKSGEWFFFEINPNGQWAWLDLEGITDIGNVLLNAMQINPSRS